MGQQVWYLRRGAITQYSLRNTYDGELYQGMRHGFGIFHYANGARYEGQWKYNVKSGKVCLGLYCTVIIQTSSPANSRLNTNIYN